MTLKEIPGALIAVDCLGNVDVRHKVDNEHKFKRTDGTHSSSKVSHPTPLDAALSISNLAHKTIAR
ncbi:MAG: hypothetical protein LBB23_03080 [Rickettsiales bacterium]|nr:hypothetical protein [Rickettsiales bacterium]